MLSFYIYRIMKIITKNLSKGFVKIQTTNTDDLWYLSQLISPGDIISGKTIRKIKIGELDERKSSVIKKPVFIKIKSEKIDYTAETLKILGPIIEGPEDVPKGSYHSFNLEENSTITIEKVRWYSFQIKKLQESAESQLPKILICVMDREEAYFAVSQQLGYKLLSQIEGNVEKKEKRATIKNTFYQDIIQHLKEYSERYSIEKILLASPAFWKDETIKLITDQELKKKITLVTCSSASENAINEVLKRPETKQVLKQDRTTKEINLVDELLKEIAIDNKAVYGLEEVKQASDLGAIQDLLITDKFIQQTRLDNVYNEIDQLLKQVDQNQGTINIISSVHDGGKKLDGLGGIAAILRYKINY